MSEELNPMQQESQNADQLAYEINFIKRQTYEYVLKASVDIGERLTAAKELVPHGQWTEWLAEKVDYSQSTANNFMRIYREYSDDQISMTGRTKSETFASLSYSQAVALFALPEHQREEFVEQHDVSDMSIKELKEAIAAQKAAEAERDAARAETEAARMTLAATRREMGVIESEAKTAGKERDDANKKAAKAIAEAGKANNKAEKAKEEAERLQKELDAANARMKALTSAPAEVSEEARAEIEAEIKRKYDDQVSQLTLDVETARQRAEAIAAEKAALEAKAAQQVNDSMMKLNILFEQSQRTMQDMKRLIDGCPSEQRDKLNGLIMQTLTGIFGKS